MQLTWQGPDCSGGCRNKGGGRTRRQKFAVMAALLRSSAKAPPGRGFAKRPKN
jgi:hypothetical protein